MHACIRKDLVPTKGCFADKAAARAFIEMPEIDRTIAIAILVYLWYASGSHVFFYLVVPTMKFKKEIIQMPMIVIIIYGQTFTPSSVVGI